LYRSIKRSKLDRMNIDLVLAVHPLPLESSRCWRLGMIAAELMANAARRAFPGRRGEIRVELFRAGRLAKCVVADDGSAPAQARPGRGFRIVEELTASLDGWFERKLGPAESSSILTFPYHRPSEESPRRNSQAPESAGNKENGARTPDLDRTSELPWR